MQDQENSSRSIREDELLFHANNFNNSSKRTTSIAPLIRKSLNPLSKGKIKGFQNDTWKNRALRIAYFISKFLLILRQNTEKIKFKLMSSKIFSVIGDHSSDFAFYQNQGLIYSKPTFLQKLHYQVFKYLRLNITQLGSSQQCLNKQNSKYFIFMPDSLQKTCWNAFLLLIIVINIFYIPLQIGFNMEDLNTSSSSQIKLIFELIPTITYTFDILINFNTAFYNEGLIHTSRKKIVINYFNEDFLSDFVVLLPFYFSYLFKIPYIQFLLLVRIKKVSKLVKNLEEVLNLREKYAALVDLLKLVYLMLLVSHYCACTFFYIGVLQERSGDSSWLSHYQLLNSGKITQYINSVYWSTITILTVGYGDITPTTNEEKIFCIIASLITIGFYGYLINSIGSIFKEIEDKRAQLQNQISTINVFLKKNNLNKQLQLKVRRYFEHYFQKQQLQDESEGLKMIYELDEELKQEVLVDIYKKVLVQSKFLAENVSIQCLNELCNIVKTQKYHTNEVIFNKGQLCSRLYFLKSGSIQIYYQRAQIKNGKIIQTPLKNIKMPGHVLCEKQFLLNQFCEYSAKAIKTTQVSFIEQKEFLDILKNHPSDYEKFCLMKDNLIFNKLYKKFTTVCEICGSLHSFSECPFPFYQANKDKIVSEENKPNLMKTQNESKKLTNYVQQFNLFDVQNLALVRILDQNLVDINILTDDYLESLGFADIKQNNESQNLCQKSLTQVQVAKNGKMVTIKEEDNNELIEQLDLESEDNNSKIQNERNQCQDYQINRFQLKIPTMKTLENYQLSARSNSQKNRDKTNRNDYSISNLSESHSDIEPSCNSSSVSINQVEAKNGRSLRNCVFSNKNIQQKKKISSSQIAQKTTDKTLSTQLGNLYAQQQINTRGNPNDFTLDLMRSPDFLKKMAQRDILKKNSIVTISKLAIKTNQFRSKIQRKDLNIMIQKKRQLVIQKARKIRESVIYPTSFMKSTELHLLDPFEIASNSVVKKPQKDLSPISEGSANRQQKLKSMVSKQDSNLSLRVLDVIESKQNFKEYQISNESQSYQFDKNKSMISQSFVKLPELEIDHFSNFSFFFPNKNFEEVIKKINNQSQATLQKMNQGKQVKLHKKMQGIFHKRRFSEGRSVHVINVAQNETGGQFEEFS